jgi:hypothetical protein
LWFLSFVCSCFGSGLNGSVLSSHRTCSSPSYLLPPIFSWSCSSSADFHFCFAHRSHLPQPSVFVLLVCGAARAPDSVGTNFSPCIFFPADFVCVQWCCAPVPLSLILVFSPAVVYHPRLFFSAHRPVEGFGFQLLPRSGPSHFSTLVSLYSQAYVSSRSRAGGSSHASV